MGLRRCSGWQLRLLTLVGVIGSCATQVPTLGADSMWETWEAPPNSKDEKLQKDTHWRSGHRAGDEDSISVFSDDVVAGGHKDFNENSDEDLDAENSESSTDDSDSDETESNDVNLRDFDVLKHIRNGLKQSAKVAPASVTDTLTLTPLRMIGLEPLSNALETFMAVSRWKSKNGSAAGRWMETAKDLGTVGGLAGLGAGMMANNATQNWIKKKAGSGWKGRLAAVTVGKMLGACAAGFVHGFVKSIVPEQKWGVRKTVGNLLMGRKKAKPKFEETVDEEESESESEFRGK